jgi:hypothetical protein
MPAISSLDLDREPRSIIGTREFERDRVIKEYGADKGWVQTMARLTDYVAARAQFRRDFLRAVVGNKT